MPVPQAVVSVMVGVGIIVGAIQCFAGYRLLKVMLGFLGFVLGGVLAGGGAWVAWQSQAAAVTVGLIGGIIGAVVMVPLYFVSVFLLGAILGAFASAALFGAGGGTAQFIVQLIFALIGGALAVLFQKFMIILSTAFLGAGNVVVGIAYFTASAAASTGIVNFFRSGGDTPYLFLFFWVVLGSLGVLAQYLSAPRPVATDKGKPDADKR